ncbi:hypothetical protein GW17_00025317 [Ensete ventricosum]|nr:hypothetical protein GW17_00025317 [Ensete ventricosum]
MRWEFAKGIGKLTENTLEDRQKKTIRLTGRMPEITRIPRVRSIVELDARSYFSTCTNLSLPLLLVSIDPNGGSSHSPSTEAFGGTGLFEGDLKPLARVAPSSGSTKDEMVLHPRTRHRVAPRASAHGRVATRDYKTSSSSYARATRGVRSPLGIIPCLSRRTPSEES